MCRARGAPPPRAPPPPPQVVLADETTRLLHGAGVLDSIKETAAQLFKTDGAAAGGGLEDLPSVSLGRAELDGGVPVVELFTKLGFAKSKSEVRRLIQGGGARLNDEKIGDDTLVVTAEQFTDGQLKVSSGKKKHGLIKLEE